MLLTITTTAENATDLGYLLHKNPASLFEKALTFGVARVYYPEATPERCTAALQVEIDPVGLVRGANGRTLAQYVSDRPYAPSSFLSVAIAEAFGTAMGGRSKERPARVEEKLPLTVTLPALACDGGESLIRRVFEPMGYTAAVERATYLDDRFPEWGAGNRYAITLTGEQTVRDLLTHLYVLIPVLDNAKHYAIGDDEVDKLVKRGEGWLNSHPEKELIARRYLRYRRPLTDAALERLADVEGLPDADAPEATTLRADESEQSLERPVRLNDRRIEAVVEAVRATEPASRRVVDLGCGEGKTVARILQEVRGLEYVAGMDVSPMALTFAERRLHLDRMGDRERQRIGLFQGSLVYRDARLNGFDVAILQEVVEHLDAERLSALVRVVWEFAHPRRIIVTTPNADYNSVWPSLPAGKFRHPDHRFEWTRVEFAAWAEGVAQAHSYRVAFSGIGEEDTEAGRGTATQMGVFDRIANG